MRLTSLGLLALSLVASGCRCGGNVSTVKPSLGVAPSAVDFGPVKVGAAAELPVRLAAQTQAPVALSGLTVEAGNGPGGPEAFTVVDPPAQVDALGQVTVMVRFAPTVRELYGATLVIKSDDADRPTVRVPLLGEGAQPSIEVTPDCDPARQCQGSVGLDPPSLDFGAVPYQRQLPPDPSKLPMVVIVNAGQVPLVVSAATFSGPDAAAFMLAQGAVFPAGGLTLGPGEGRNLQLELKPTSEQQQSYQAQLTIASDDPDRPQVVVALSGTLAANLPPAVCANLVRVVPPPGGDAPRDYSQSAEWDPLKVPPPGGYDFTLDRDVRPGDLAVFSALSSANDPTACTSDPEDGRTGLTWAWRLTAAPAGAEGLALSGATTPQVQLRPVVTGDYQLELTVADAQGHATVVTMRFAVAIKQDLVAQLQWTGAADVDLDVHLVRPSAAVDPADPFSGVFSFFEAGAAGKTAGDINGYAVTTQHANPGAGYDFDWGQPGASDDPVLNVDDIGSGPLVENVSLNYPEHDPLCATTSCTYKVLVHYFKDARNHVAPPPCLVDGGTGCTDGEACGCAAPDRCVADGAPIGDAGVGAGKCYPPPEPVVRLFFRGSPTPAQVIPLDTLSPPDALALGAPCQMLYVADVEWPAATAIGSLPDGGTPPPVVTVKGADATGRVVSPLVGRFGWRQAGGSLQCSPDDTRGAVPWYAREP